MKVLYFNNTNSSPQTLDIRRTLENYQKLVGGYIEVLYLTPNTALVCDEEGKLKGKAPRIMLYGLHGSDETAFTYIVGDFFLCGYKEERFTDYKSDPLLEITKDSITILH